MAAGAVLGKNRRVDKLLEQRRVRREVLAVAGIAIRRSSQDNLAAATGAEPTQFSIQVVMIVPQTPGSATQQL